MFTPNEDLLRTVRANWLDSDPIVSQLATSLEGIMDEMEEALEKLAEAKLAVDKAAQMLEDYTKEDLPTEGVLESLYTALEHLKDVKTALINR